MSWSITVNNLQDVSLETVLASPAQGSEATVQEYIESQHPLYPSDLAEAFFLAKRLGFESVTLTGMRTPNPYGDDEVVDVSVRGLMKGHDFNAEVQRILRAGPDGTRLG